MGRLPEFALYRRFGALNSLNLLYLQTELREMEHRLHEISMVAAYSSDPVERQSDYNWTSLSRTDASGNLTEQYKLVLSIREMLQQYSQVEVSLRCSH